VRKNRRILEPLVYSIFDLVLPTPKRFGQHAKVSFQQKVISWADLPKWRAHLRETAKKLVVTNGCFDLLHLGHVTYLEAARGRGDALLVGVNSDESVRGLKGPDRPLNSEAARAAVIAALESVNGVCIFSDRNASRFLEVSQPDIYVKGGDYTLDTLNQEERRIVESAGGKIVIIPLVPDISTTRLLNKICG
jgi:rfaE bifunctional protein nucleotidyltransferase chain/domain